MTKYISNTKFTNLSVQFSTVKYIHNANVQPSPLCISRTISFFQSEILFPLNSSFPFTSPPSPRQPVVYFLSKLIWLLYLMDVYFSFCDWIFSFTTTYSMFIHVAFFSSRSYFKYILYSFSPLLGLGHLGCFCFLPIMNSVPTSIWVQVFTWIYVFSSLKVVVV